MHNNPIIVIAAKEDQTVYHALSDMNERVEAYACTEPAELSTYHECDLFILDCGLDADGGVKFLRELKQSRPEVPIIFIAPASSRDIVIEAFKAGARECFRKPFSIYGLKETVAGLLRLKRSSREKRTSLSRSDDDIAVGIPRPVTVDLPDRLLRVVRYIESNFTHEIYLDKLAQDASLSKYHFCRVFKRHVGMTPMEFVTFMRIEKARQLLAKAGLSVSEVAHKAGFNDASDFVRKFKKFTGVTPSAYKDLSQQK